MAAIVHKETDDVNNRLETIGWTASQLLEIAEAMVGARRSCTDNDPPGAPGWLSWRAGTVRLRQLGRVMGLEKDDTDSISSVIDQKRCVRLIVSNTDEATGLEGSGPQNRSKKGAATDRVISANQGSFLEALDESVGLGAGSNFKHSSSGLVSWYLCVYAEGDEFRIELSCPVSIEAGFFTDFIERIFIDVNEKEGSSGSRPQESNFDDDEADYEIPVSRK